MANRKVTLSTGEYYHIYNRGNSKQIIFLDDQDKKRFVKLLCLLNQSQRVRTDEIELEDSFRKNSDQVVAIGAYVLMDNHFHFLLKQITEGGVSQFMHKLSTAYAMYFNKKYKHTGSLFEGVFKAKHVDEDVYLKYLYAYIHLNPAKMVDEHWKKGVVERKKEIVDFIKQYPYSSFHDYCGVVRPQNLILSPHEFPFYFTTPREFIDSILQWIGLDDRQK